MSFAFTFEGDDIEEGENQAVDEVAESFAQVAIQPPTSEPPALVDLHQALATLPSQISCNALSISGASPVYRRSLFDIRAQLMAEADISNHNDDLLTGLDAGDLTSGVYEGGFKTWECAVDLAEYVFSRSFEGNWHVIELGAGSAIPSCALIAKILQHETIAKNKRIHFSLCDYNADVLKLCTIPNVFLNAYFALKGAHCSTGDQDIDLEGIDLDTFFENLNARSLSFSMLSSSWGPELAKLVVSSRPQMRNANILVLASETIYSPESMGAFVDTVIALLQETSASTTALIAAKQMYFGVGGGVEEFVRETQSRGALVRTVSTVSTEGVGRVILEVNLVKTEL